MKLVIHAPVLLLSSLPPAAAAQLGDTPEAGDLVGTALAIGDFDVDGIGDVAIGVPGESVSFITFPPTTPSTFDKAGMVHLVFGQPGGLTFAPKKLLKQPPAIGSEPGLGTGNGYGTALLRLDFNADGFDDLAVGIPGQKINGFAGAGAVQVLFGTGHGLDVHTPFYVHQDSSGVPDAAEAGDAFGAVLCAGDFNADGFEDLGVSAPSERVGSLAKAGAVNVIYGGTDGLPMSKSAFLTQGTELQDPAEAGDLFGRALAAGDLDADGFDDLAVGVPEEDLAFAGSGAVHVLYGAVKGINPGENQLWHQDTPGVAGEAESNDLYGSALVTGDLDFDGIEDLSIGAPGDSIEGVRAGSVTTLFGTTAGLAATDNLLLSQLIFSPFLEVPEQGDRFGSCLGLHSHDGFTLVVIGIPGEWEGSVPDAGGVQAFGVGPSREVGYGMTMTFAYSPPQKGDGVGSALATGDVDGNGYPDYAVGVPFKDMGAKDAGEVLITLLAAPPYLEVLRQGSF